MSKNVIGSAAVKGNETVNQEGGIKKYTFRTLNSTDIFLMFKIFSKIGINEFSDCLNKDSVKKMIAQVTTGKAQGDATTIVGISVIMEVANIVIGNLPKCETEIYQMLANTSDLTVDEIKALDFASFAEMVIDFIKKEEFKDFIKVVLRLFKPEN